MLDAREAAISALDHFTTLKGERELAGIDSAKISLEEIELSEDTHAWKVTLSYPDPDRLDPDETRKEGTLAHLVGRWPARKYKVLQIDAEDGRLLSMRIPEP